MALLKSITLEEMVRGGSLMTMATNYLMCPCDFKNANWWFAYVILVACYKILALWDHLKLVRSYW